MPPKPLWTLHEPLAADLPQILSLVPSATVSSTLLATPAVKWVLFTMDTGQELSPHSSPQSAVILVLEGQLRVTVGDSPFTVDAQSAVVLPANLPHAVLALQPTRFLLSMFQPDAPSR